MMQSLLPRVNVTLQRLEQFDSCFCLMMPGLDADSAVTVFCRHPGMFLAGAQRLSSTEYLLNG